MSADRQPTAERLHSAALHLLRVVRTADEAMGLSPARASALSVLVFGGSCTIGALARSERVRSPTMTTLVNGLEEAGLAARRPDPDDARQVLVEATPAGRRLMRKGQARRVAVLQELLADLSDGDIATLDRAAHLIEEAIARRTPTTGPRR
jgi:DNA-binding MarR family transcriptional regulator